MSVDDMIRRATAGTISPSEIDTVARSLEKGEGDEYDRLLILGRANAIEYRPLVEKYLDSPDDPMLARLAVQILCRYWGLASEYSDVLERFIRKVPWDEEEDVRVMAVSCCDVLLAKPDFKHLLEYIYELFQDESECSILRQAAYCAIAISVGKLPSDLPSPARFDFHKDIDPGVIAEAQRRVSHD